MTHAHCYLHTRILAIDPFTKGFAFALLEGPEHLVDWALKYPKENTPQAFLEELGAIMSHYQPQVLVVEDITGFASRRCSRIQHLIARAAKLAHDRQMQVATYTRSQIKMVFGYQNKEQMARKIAEYFPELEYKLPKPRKIWMSEDDRMNLFDAVSLALTHFFHKP